jgi:hypothetical protein
MPIGIFRAGPLRREWGAPVFRRVRTSRKFPRIELSCRPYRKPQLAREVSPIAAVTGLQQRPRASSPKKPREALKSLSCAGCDIGT